MYLTKPWGTNPRFRKYEDSCGLHNKYPGPGEYDVAQPSWNCSTKNENYLAMELPRSREKGLPPVRRKVLNGTFTELKLERRKNEKTRDLLQGKKSTKRNEFINNKRNNNNNNNNNNSDSNNTNERKKEAKHTFGMGRLSSDPWGRDLPKDNPGPGSFNPVVEGSFLKIEHDFTENMEFTELTYLKGIKRRLKRIRELQRKFDLGTLDIEEKIHYKQETNPKTLRRLNKAKERYERLVDRRKRELEDRLRPRTSCVLDQNSQYSQRGVSSHLQRPQSSWSFRSSNSQSGLQHSTPPIQSMLLIDSPSKETNEVNIWKNPHFDDNNGVFASDNLDQHQKGNDDDIHTKPKNTLPKPSFWPNFKTKSPMGGIRSSNSSQYHQINHVHFSDEPFKNGLL